MRSDAYFTSYGYGIGCDGEAVTRGDTTLHIYMCTWDSAARGEPPRVLRAGDRVAAVTHGTGSGPTLPAEARILAILAGTATP